jgi:hypothetical protein
MTQHAKGTFDVKLEPEANDSVPAGVALARLAIDKQFSGDLEATSKGAMLSARTPVADSAGYVAIERVTGVLKGRRGSFVLQHNGTLNRGVQHLTIQVVPDSGTDELTGLAGEMKINIAGGQHFYEFDYTLASET